MTGQTGKGVGREISGHGTGGSQGIVLGEKSAGDSCPSAQQGPSRCAGPTLSLWRWNELPGLSRASAGGLPSPLEPWPGKAEMQTNANSSSGSLALEFPKTPTLAI